MKYIDHYYDELTTNEVVQQQRIQPASSSSKSPFCPSLSMKKHGTGLGPDIKLQNTILTTSKKDYIFSLHQNTDSMLLYGKNNVTVCPADFSEPLKGYLSLHLQSTGDLRIKWTPNDLMSGEDNELPPLIPGRTSLWKFALNLSVNEIIYLHFHQQGDFGGSIVFIGTDGVQYPPLEFPEGQYLLAFLSCLENGLLPWKQLDPPLWLQKGKGKIFPQLRRKSTLSNGRFIGHDFQTQQTSIFPRENDELPEGGVQSHDYVFRIVPIMKMSTIDTSLNRITITPNGTSRLVALSGLSTLFKERFLSLSTSLSTSPPTTPLTAYSGDSVVSEFQQFESPVEPSIPTIEEISTKDDLYSLDETRGRLMRTCVSVRNQIVFRAFYGWLAHCRHMKTVRNHLSCLLLREPIEMTTIGITEQLWRELTSNRTPESEKRLHRHIYSNGIEPQLRSEVWPYLLGLVNWEESLDDFMTELKVTYEDIMSQWKEVEEIVRRQDQQAIYTARNCWQLSNSATRLIDGQIEPITANNGVYTSDQINSFGMNLHRIEKDVHRCDRNNPYFTSDNLSKLKNVMCAYVWINFEHGYVQGMCDLAAPLLVIFDQEVLTYGCFCRLMEQTNFLHDDGMDANLANMRSLIQVVDPEMFDLIHHNGDYTHFYFCYRWFLLDFKRELAYKDVFLVWEVIWAATRCASKHFRLFLALALLLTYRGAILANDMDFTDMIRFFNEMAEQHDAQTVLKNAREQLSKLQKFILDSNL